MKKQLSIFLLALVFAVPAFSQDDVTCTKTPGHDVCIFAGGDVIETFSSPGHYAEYHYNSLEWQEESMRRHPAQTTAACVAGKLIEGENPCVVIYQSCQADRKHPRFTKRQCAEAYDNLNQP